jgi:hypothetical protein
MPGVKNAEHHRVRVTIGRVPHERISYGEIHFRTAAARMASEIPLHLRNTICVRYVGKISDNEKQTQVRHITPSDAATTLWYPTKYVLGKHERFVEVYDTRAPELLDFEKLIGDFHKIDASKMGVHTIIYAYTVAINIRDWRRCVCDGCLEEKPKLHKCARCMLVSYCSKSCQKSRWPTHKITCSKPKNTQVPRIEELD